MAYTRKSKKKQNNTATYIFAAAGAVVLIVLIVAIAIKLAGPGAQQADATPTPVITATPMPSHSADIVYTAPPQENTTQPLQSATPLPSIQQETLTVPDNKIFAIHLTVESGNTLDEEPVFDESYAIINEDETDYTDVRLMVFLTDYKGNSRVYRFDTADVTLRLRTFLLPGQNTPSEIEDLSLLSIRVDGAQNLHMTWAGNTIRVDGEGTGVNHLTAKYGDAEITATAKPLGLLDKADYQR